MKKDEAKDNPIYDIDISQNHKFQIIFSDDLQGEK